MGLIRNIILGSPKKETGNEQYERVTGAKSTAESAYENVTDSKRAVASATKAGSSISKWGNRISAGAGAIGGKVSSPAFQNFAKNAVSSSNNIFGGGSFGGDRDLVGLGGAARKVSKKKQGSGKLRPAFDDAKTGKTYIAKTDKKVVAKTKKKHKKEKTGPAEFDPW